MNDDLVWATVVYHQDRPGIVVVTEAGDEVGKDVPFPPASAIPQRRGLVPRPWRNVPGSEWEEDETGVWWIHVFRRLSDGE